MPAPATLSVDLNALAHNFHALEAISGVPVHPVVKADAYGLGAVPVARRLMAEGARTFFVARASGGFALRKALGAEPVIHVLDGCVGDGAAAMIAADLRPILNHGGQLAAWQAAGLGLVLSHLACGDAPDSPMNRQQRDAFAAAVQRYPGVVRSFANSGGVFLGPDFGFDAVRPGISLYGGGPEGRPDARLKPVATFEAEVLQVRDVPAGESVGYSQGFRAETPRRIAICAAGYADGVLRSTSPWGAVWLGGALRSIVGRVSMDVITVDVTGSDVALGDRAELFGANRSLDEAATAAGTIAYELLTSVTPRVPRVYIG